MRFFFDLPPLSPTATSPPLHAGEGEKKWGKSQLPGVTRYALTPGCILSPFQGDYTAYIVFFSDFSYIHAR